jgi:glycosyltransferase involved in cell wall biosynthesis
MAKEEKLNPKELKILMISVRADYGGGPEHIYSLITNLSNRIIPFIAVPEDKPYYQRFAGIVGNSRMILIPHRAFKLSTLWQLKKFIIHNKIDIIHSHGKGAGIYGRLLAILTFRKAIHTFHGIHIGEYGNIKRRLYLSFERILSGFTSKLISVSKGEYTKTVNLGISNPSKMVIIENGVHINNRRVDDSVFEASRFNVMTITRFDYAKNTGLLVPIIKYLSSEKDAGKFHFQIIGKGEEEELIKSELKVNNLEKHVTFIGFVDKPEDYYLNSFCYISTSRSEGLPLAVLEAMSFGLPVIATNVIGNNDLVEDGKTGFLFDPDQPEIAGQKLILLSNNKDLWRSLSYNSFIKISDNYSSAKMADKTEKLYLSVLTNQSEESKI